MKRCRRLLVVLVPLLLISGCVTTGGSLGVEPDLERAAQLNTELGIGYLREGMLERALAKLQRAVEQDPDYADAHAALAFTYAELREPEKAREQYEKALDLNGGNAQTRNLYGVFLCTRGRLDEAMAQFQRAARDRDNDSPEVALTNAGVCEQQRGNVVGAEALFRDALERNPRYSPAMLQMADLSYRKHNYVQARAFMRRFEALVPHNAGSLSLAYRIEQALGNEAAAARYRERLRSEYPESDATAEVWESESYEK